MNYLPQTSIQQFLLQQPQRPMQPSGGLLGVDSGLLSAGTTAFKPMQQQMDISDVMPKKPELSPEVAAQPDLPKDPTLLSGLRGGIDQYIRQPLAGLQDQAAMAGYDMYNKLVPPPSFGGQMQMPETGPTASSQRQQELMQNILRVIGGM